MLLYFLYKILPGYLKECRARTLPPKPTPIPTYRTMPKWFKTSFTCRDKKLKDSKCLTCQLHSRHLLSFTPGIWFSMGLFSSFSNNVLNKKVNALAGFELRSPEYRSITLTTRPPPLPCLRWFTFCKTGQFSFSFSSSLDSCFLNWSETCLLHLSKWRPVLGKVFLTFRKSSHQPNYICLAVWLMIW